LLRFARNDELTVEIARKKDYVTVIFLCLARPNRAIRRNTLVDDAVSSVGMT
jgi:hypothetical protein